MNFELDQEHRILRDTIRDFAKNEIEPLAMEFEEAGRFPKEIIDKMAELGLMGMCVPEQYGGSGMDYLSYAIAMEEISRKSASCGVIMSVNNSLVCDPLLKNGTETQKTEVLSRLASGRSLGCFGLTEPDAGSDAANQKTTAKRVDGGWLINGTKNFITNAPVADFCILFARTSKEKHKGISCFLLPMDTEGVSTGEPENKMGIKASPTSTIILEDVRLPEDALLGKEGEGFKIAMQTLDGGRIGIAAQALGIAQAALDKAIEYAKQRTQFGAPIARLQAIQFKLSDMATEVEAARNLVYYAAWLRDQKKRHTKESAMAKLYASKVAVKVADECIQIHGGYGYIKEYGVERLLRDAKITEIYEGTSEIQRIIISSMAFKE